jgi:hypothetical protein
MTLLNNLTDNNYIIYSSISISLCLISYFLLKSYYSHIETPNSPPTFNLNHDQIKEINDILDRGDKLDKETQDKLDEDFKNMLGDDKIKFDQEIQDQLRDQLQDIFTNLC